MSRSKEIIISYQGNRYVVPRGAIIQGGVIELPGNRFIIVGDIDAWNQVGGVWIHQNRPTRITAKQARTYPHRHQARSA